MRPGAVVDIHGEQCRVAYVDEGWAIVEREHETDEPYAIHRDSRQAYALEYHVPAEAGGKWCVNEAPSVLAEHGTWEAAVAAGAVRALDAIHGLPGEQVSPLGAVII